MSTKGQGHSVSVAKVSQISCWASFGCRNESLFKYSRSYDQDGRRSHIWLKPFKICSGTDSPMTLILCIQHWVLKYYQVCSNDTPGLILTYFTARSNLVPYDVVCEKVKTKDFSETVVVYDIKNGRCSQLNEYMKLYEYHMSRSLIDLGLNHWDSLFSNFFSLITADFNTPDRWAIQDQGSSDFYRCAS